MKYAARIHTTVQAVEAMAAANHVPARRTPFFGWRRLLGRGMSGPQACSFSGCQQPPSVLIVQPGNVPFPVCLSHSRMYPSHSIAALDEFEDGS